MFNNYKTKVILILLFLLIILRADPLLGVKDYYSSSQVLYSHCSLIPYQKFYPSSFEILFSSESKDIVLKYASLFSFKKNGFAFGYRKLENKGNVISTAYGMKHSFFTFGSGFNVYFKNSDPSLLINVSSSVNIKDYNRVAISINNIGNLHKENIYPKVFVESAGKIFKNYNINYNFGIYSDLESNNLKRNSSGFNVDIKGKLLKKPSFYYSIGYELYYHKIIKMYHRLNAGFGSIASFNDNGVGLFFGYCYDVTTKGNKIQCNIKFDPFEFRDITPPQVSMDIKCRSDNISGYFISLKCVDNEEGSGLKNWTLVFSDKPTKDAKIYKIFSGGNTPPSTVYWDLRDKSGEVLDTVSFYSRLVAIDNKNNIGSSPWVFISPCNQ